MRRVDWSRIADDILIRIVEDFVTRVEDYLSICRVCRSWNSIARAIDKSKSRNKWSCEIPLLMLTDGNDAEVYADGTKIIDRSAGAYSMITESNFTLFRLNVKEYVAGCDMSPAIDARIHSDDEDDDKNTNNNNEDHSNTTRCMFSLVRERNKNNNNNKCFLVSLPMAYKRACWGSRYGWIVTLGRDRQMCLLNPLTKATLPLPSQRNFVLPWKGSSGKTIRNMFINKAVLVQVPRADHLHSHISLESPCCAYNNGNIWVVVVIHQTELLASIAKPGDSSWTPILRPARGNNYFRRLQDVTYCSRLNSLLFVDEDTRVWICGLEDIERPQVLKRVVPSVGVKYIPRDSVVTRHYIVDSGTNDILIILHYILYSKNGTFDGRKIEDHSKFDDYLTLKFSVYKIDFLTKKLEEVYDLGKSAVFLGNNASIWVPSTQTGCDANSI